VIPNRFITGLVTHIGAIELVNAAVLNCDTWKLPVLKAVQEPTPTEYTNVFVPIAARDGVIIPLVAPIGFPATPVVNVPPVGVTVIVTGANVLQRLLIGVIVGVTGFTTVAVKVFVIGQLTAVGVRVTE
jgi:hypothetical protein